MLVLSPMMSVVLNTIWWYLYVRTSAGRWYRDVVGGTGIQAGIRFLF